jgi:signal transduction histidine kinase
MQRRLVFAMVAMVLATLLLSGLVSLVLAQRTAVDQTRHELIGEATGLSESVLQESGGPVRLRQLLVALGPSLRLSGSTVVGVQPDGRLFDPAALRDTVQLPSGLSVADIEPYALYQLRTVSGRTGTLVFAAVPFRADIRLAGADRQIISAVILTRRPPGALRTAGPWFLLSAMVIILVAVLIAWRLARRFQAPLRAAQEVTSRIAAGDLDVRVPDALGTDPELSALAESVNSMAESLARAKAAERHFLQSVSHDLRTPLTSIRGFAEAIEDGATADAVAAAGVIASESRRLERLVGDLLALATLEARRFTLQMQPVEVQPAAVSAVAGFVPSADELGLGLSVAPDDGLWVQADPDRLAQVIANLVENALRYARSGITVTATRGPTGPELWVVDDGPGIPPADLPRLFDRLYSGRRHPDGARPGRPIGSGLGLMIVAELVAAMGGTIRAESPVTRDGGTRMVVALAPADAPVTAV